MTHGMSFPAGFPEALALEPLPAAASGTWSENEEGTPDPGQGELLLTQDLILSLGLFGDRN